MEESEAREAMEEQGFEVVEVDGEEGYICWWVVLGRKGKTWAVYAVKYDAPANVYAELAQMAAEHPGIDEKPEPDFVECLVNEFKTLKSEKQARKAFSKLRHEVSR